MAARVVLILGAGPNIGAHLASAFEARGYKVALASRSADSSQNTVTKVHVKVDLTQPESVKGVFESVEKQVGVPGVVIYNASAATFGDAQNPLDPQKLSVETFARNLATNTTSVFAAAQAAVAAFAKLPESASKTFIYTGNGLNTRPMPTFVDLGVGKSASSHLIQLLAGAYKEQGYKFYYADQRKEDGSYVNPVGGEAAGEFYPQLAESKEQGEWQQTFVQGKGHVKF